MTRTLPTYAVEVAWSRALTGVFTLDTSVLDGPDVLAGFSGAAGTSYDAITGDVKRLRISRGRPSDLGGMEQGQCTLLLADSHGTYNPSNPSSPLAGTLVPMRPVRVRATHLGVDYGLFRGFITRIEHDPARNVQETTIQAADLFEWLNVSRPTITSIGATTVGAAIGRVLDALGWTDPALRDLDTGHSIPDFSAAGTSTALELIAALLTVDLGDFFINGDGIAVYRDTDHRYSSALSVDLPATLVSGARPSTEVARVRNGWTVTRTGGTPQTALDTTSRTDYGPRDGSPITSPYLASDIQAGALANFLLVLNKDPQSPIQAMKLWNRDDTAIGHQLAREIGDRVTFSESAGGTVTDGSIEHLDHEVSDGGKLHLTTYQLRKRELDGFTLDISTLDGTDVLVY